MSRILSIVLCLVVLSASCKKDSDSPDGDISSLIVGKWKYNQTSCNSGYTFRQDGSWSFGDFEACGNVCGAMPFGGTYEIVNGNRIQSIGGPGQNDSLNGRVEISNDTMKIYDESTGNLIGSFTKVNNC